MDASIEKRPRTRLSPQKRKLQLMEIALEVFAKRGIGRGGHADIAEQILPRLRKSPLQPCSTTSQLVKTWLTMC